ncbi:MAG: ChbG/HpnK family deacetylase [Clostridiales bacterium]|nr:ChbG/HpnK family deacetylase [Clostridiales bacterium]
MRFFISADDFGYNHSINMATDEAFRKGWIQRASLMMNMEGTDEAVTLAREHGYMDKIAFHLNLTVWYPLTEEVKTTYICNSEGRFRYGVTNYQVHKYALSREVIAKIRKECEAQMIKFRAFGFTSEHIDAHRWIICNLPVFLAIWPLLRKYKFKTTRSLEGHYLNSIEGENRKYCRRVYSLIKLKLRVKESFSGCPSEFFENIENGKFKKNSRAEVYVHPDMVDGTCVDLFYNYSNDKKPIEEIAERASRSGNPISVG